MNVLAKVRHLRDLQTAASLPESSKFWLEKGIEPSDVRIHTTRKQRGGYREVCQPVDDELLRLQKRLKEFIDRKVLTPHQSVHGFTRGRSTVSNAKVHLGARAILTIDISDFFASICRARVVASLQGSGANSEVAFAIANTCTYNGVLATGFSTSPVISNLVFRPLDDIFDAFASSHGITYSRYADDLTFSGDEVTDDMLAHVNDTLVSQGFLVNSKKVRFQRRGHRQVVTGFAIQDASRLRVPKWQKKALRHDLYCSETFGLEDQARFRNMTEEEFRVHLLGKINYLAAVEPLLAADMRAQLDNL
ncbi:reverse transcriptase family protein [Arthrobacter sp. NPDC093139]|uniref:reverse transcriptase family protein n=1 Tax=Arthrobacter sp. NPDC093139 TaxID=3363945 RepID=UPI0038166E2C